MFDNVNIVLFDLGSTLIYFDADWQEALPRASRVLLASLLKMGFSLDEEKFLSTLMERQEVYYRKRTVDMTEPTMESLAREVLAGYGYADVPDLPLRQALVKMYAVTEAHWQVEEDTLSTLQTLKERGHHIGLISNASDADNVQRLIDKAGIRSYLETILISAAVGIRKPHPQIFHMALNHWHASPGQAVMVGDLLDTDVLGARGVGMGSVWITRRALTNPLNLTAAGTVQPDATIAALTELPALLPPL